MTKRPTKTSRATAAKRTAAKTTPATKPTPANDTAPNDNEAVTPDRALDCIDAAIISGAAGVAKVTHEANRAWCELNGDQSQVRYEDAPVWQQNSAVAGVLFHIKNPGASASASHDNWMAEKLADGWVYGEDKDPEKKTHPCLVPFHELPEQQQAKDRLFKAIVHALNPHVVREETLDGPPAMTVFGFVPGEADPDPLVVSPLYEADEPALRAFVAAQAAGELIDRDTMAEWPEGALNGLIAYAAEQCRAYEGVNSEALYLALESELRKGLYWPNGSADMELDSEGRKTSQPQSLLWAYDEARPDVLAWVEVFARTVDFLDQLHRDHPPAGKPTDADTEAA